MPSINPHRYPGKKSARRRLSNVSHGSADDNKPGAEKTTILGYEIWKRDFGGDPGIVGQSLRINGKAATIIGVMPEGFKFPQAE